MQSRVGNSRSEEVEKVSKLYCECCKGNDRCDSSGGSSDSSHTADMDTVSMHAVFCRVKQRRTCYHRMVVVCEVVCAHCDWCTTVVELHMIHTHVTKVTQVTSHPATHPPHPRASTADSTQSINRSPTCSSPCANKHSARFCIHLIVSM